MLLIAEPVAEQILEPLSAEALSAWLGAVGRCSHLRADILDPHELQGTPDEVIDEWEHAALAVRLPFGNVRFLARRLLWDYDGAPGWAA